MNHLLTTIFSVILLMLAAVPDSEAGPNPIHIGGFSADVLVWPENQRHFRVAVPSLEKDLAAVLRWRARISADRLRGGREFMRVAINGITVAAMQDRLETRLLNKPVEFTDHINRRQSWYMDSAEGWLTPFSPDFSQPGAKTWFYKLGDNAYLYEVDVTDLLKAGAQNLILFENKTQQRYVQKYRKGLFEQSSGQLVLKDIRLEFRKREPATARQPESGTALPTDRDQWVFQVGPSGAMTLHWNSMAVRFESVFANGDGTWSAPFQENGTGRISGSSTTSWKFSAETAQYRIERTVERHPDRIRVQDRIEKVGNTGVSVVIPRYRVFVPTNRFATVWIGGDADPLLNNVFSPYNPTLYIPMHGPGLGMVVEDDVMRLQGKFSYDAGRGMAEIRSDELVVSPEGSNAYTLSLTLYPTRHDSYWKFINKVRHDWKVNAVMPGTIWFTYPEQVIQLPARDLTAFLEKNNVARVIFWENPSPRFHMLQPPYLIRGPAQLREEAQNVRSVYEANLKEAIGRLHDLRTEGVKVLLYFHSHTISLFDEMRLDELSGALITTKDGRPIRRHQNDPRYYPLYYVYPTEDNGYGRELDRLLNHLLGLGADGIYWDEMPAGTRMTRSTYAAFDGFSADISPQRQQIRQLKGLVGLLSASYKSGRVTRLLQNGKAVHANGAPETRALQHLAMTVMVETKTSAALTKRLHLTTPYAYTWGPLNMDQFRDRLGRGGLVFRPGKRASFIARSFPMTPEYIGNGFVAGKERIVAAVSGDFGWDGSWKAVLTLYDKSGQMVERLNTNGVDKRSLDVPEHGLAILERTF